MSGADGEPTLGEVARAIAQMRDDVRSEFAAITLRLDKFVLAEVYAATQRAADERLAEVNRRIDALRADREADVKSAAEARIREEARSVQQRRWIIGSILLPLLIVLIPYLIAHHK